MRAEFVRGHSADRKGGVDERARDVGSSVPRDMN